MKHGQRRWIAIGVWATAALLAGLLPARARHFTAWRFDGSPTYVTTAGTEARNLGFNPYDEYLDPSAPEFGLYWKSGDRVDTAAILPEQTPVAPPVVIELANPGDEDILWDHLVLVPRGTQLAAYYPETASGMGAVTAAGNTPSPRWVLDLRTFLGGVDGLANPAPADAVRISGSLVTTVTTVTVAGRTVLLRLLYLLVGPDPGGTQPARIVCVRLNATNPQDAPTNDPTLPAPIDNPILWVHRVTNAAGNPVGVVGMVLGDLGSPSLPEPVLFLTTLNGELHCVQAPPIGSPALRWRWSMPAPPAGIPAFGWGAIPAFARIRLASPALPPSTITQAIANGVSENMVFIAGNDGYVRAFDAEGAPRAGGGFDPDLRWEIRLFDRSGNPERFMVGPIVFNPATPIRNSAGSLVSGTVDYGFDDIVVVAGESGRVHALDAMGHLRGPGANEGQPTGQTHIRWQYPDFASGQFAPGIYNPAAPIELDPWPRERTSPYPAMANWTIRSPLAATTGRQANPDRAEPNTLVSDDVIFVRFDEMGDPPGMGMGPPFPPPGNPEPPGLARQRQFFEWIGAIRPYGWVELSQPLRLKQTPPPPIPTQPTREPPVEPYDPANPAQPIRVTVIKPGGTRYDVPAEFIRVGRRKGAVTINGLRLDGNDDFASDADPFQALYFSCDRWIDNAGNVRTLDFGDQLEIQYRDASDTVRTETLLYPSRRVPTAPLGDPARTFTVKRASLGVGSCRLQDPGEAPVVIQPLGLGPSPDELRPAMTVVSGPGSAGSIFVGSAHRGRVYVANFTPQPIRRLQLLNDDTVPGFYPKVSLGIAATDGWAYVTYENAHLRAYGMGLIAPGGRLPGQPPRLTPPPFFNQGIQQPVGMPEVPKPQVRVVVAPPAGTAITASVVLGLAERNEPELLYDWGERLAIRVLIFDDPLRMPPGVDPRHAASPINFVLRGPVGGPITVAVTPQPTGLTGVGEPRFYALGVITIPNASPNNPMTPGTPLLMQMASVPPGQRDRTPHWEVEASQPGVRWVVPNPMGGTIPQNWVDDPTTLPWLPSSNTAPWISLNNPLAIEYNPLGGAENTGVVNVAYVPRFTDPNHPERKNGDPYPDAMNPNRPLVATVGATIVPMSQTLRQILFAQHGRRSPASETTIPEVGRIRVYDRSDLALRGDRVRVRFQPATLVKLGVGASLGGAPIVPGAPAGSFQQNQGFLDNGPDGYYPSIPARNIVITRVGSGEDAVATPVPLSGVAGSDASKDLRYDLFNVQVDVPLHQPDDVYATRARPGGPNGSPPSLFVNPFAQPYGGYTDVPETSPPAPGDDRRQRIAVFVDADNDGQLDLQGNFREAYRTIALQVVVEPDLKLQAAETAVDLGAVWHGKAGPSSTGELGGGFDDWAYLLGTLSGPTQQFYSQYWRRITLLNTGNVNLASIKPEVVERIVGAPTPVLRWLAPVGVDRLFLLPLARDPGYGGGNSLIQPKQVHIRTSIDDLVVGPSGMGGPPGYGFGPGAWLQKAQAGAAAPGAILYTRDPTTAGAEARNLFLSVNVPAGTPIGAYQGRLNFYNDRSVVLVRDPSTGIGFRYVVQGAPGSGLLERSGAPATLRQPFEPMTEPGFEVRVRVLENMAQGRANTVAEGQDRRRMPAIAPMPGPGGALAGLLLAYATDLGTPGPASQIVATRIDRDPEAAELPFDANPWSAIPWTEPVPPGGGSLRAMIGAPLSAGIPQPFQSRPSLGIGLDAGGNRAIYAVWTGRTTTPGLDDAAHQIFFRRVLPSPGPIRVVPLATDPDRITPRTTPRLVFDTATRTWLLFYVVGSGARRSLAYRISRDLDASEPWGPEHLLAAPMGLGSLDEPSVVIEQTPYTDLDTGRTRRATWVLFTGYSQRLGRTDIYAVKYDTTDLVTAATPGNHPLSARREFGQIPFGRIEREELRGNAARTFYYASGVEWRITPTSPLQVYLQPRPIGSAVAPVPLIGSGDLGLPSANGELVFQLAPALIAAAPPAVRPQLQQVRIVVDRSAGAVRFNVDTRNLQALLGYPISPQDPDPAIRADYTPLARRLTPGDVSASSPGAVLLESSSPSWYRQQLERLRGGGLLPIVTGVASRMWVVWRREAGQAGGGPTLYYQVLRPGVQLSFPPVAVDSISVSATVGGSSGTIVPDEVDLRTGRLYFGRFVRFRGGAGTTTIPAEGLSVQVAYVPRGGAPITEPLRISWLPEVEPTAVPLRTSVNEGGVDLFGTLERIAGVSYRPLTGEPDLGLSIQRLWLFWGSARNSGAAPDGTRMAGTDLYWATLAPQIGPEPLGNFDLSTYQRLTTLQQP